jgi:hypothetical protein
VTDRQFDNYDRGSEVSINLAHWHISILAIKLTSLFSADQNGCRARSEAEIILKFRSTARELVAAPTATAAIAEADVVGSRQAVCIRGFNAGRSTIVYVTRTFAEVVDSVTSRTECNNCV